MARKIFVLLFMIAIPIYGFSQSTYQERLNSAISKIKSNTKLEAKDICAAIPATQDEYILFYGVTRDGPDEKWFSALNDSIKNYRTRDHCVLIGYLNIAAFADGEYAESYFGGIDYFYAHNKILFKKAYEELLPEAKRRLKLQIAQMESK